MFVSYVFADFFCNQATNTVTRSATQPCSACASCGAGQSGHSPLLATIAATGDGEPVLWLLTVGANASAGQAMSRRPLHAGILGLARSARLEAPAARIGYIDLYANPSNLAAVISIFTTLNNSAERRPPPNETEVLHHDASACLVPRLHSHTAAKQVPPPQATVYLLTGGTGGVGLLTARWLAQHGTAALILASRTGFLSVGAGTSTAAECATLSTCSACVHVERCDAAELTDARRLLDMATHSLTLAFLGGVWHAAGVLADGTLTQQGAASLRCVFGPKADGAVTLQHACDAVVLHASLYIYIYEPHLATFASGGNFL